MSDGSAILIPSLVLSRTYDAPVERVYAAWTDPKILQKFLGPGSVKATDIETDVRVGGKYRVVMLMDDGERMVATGVYREVQVPSRLVMTWRWEEENPSNEHDTLLTLEFFDRGGKTELVLTHENFAAADSRERHEHGWNDALDKLGRSLQ